MYAKLCAVLVFGLLVSGGSAVHPDYILTRLTESMQTSAAQKESGNGEFSALATSKQCCKLGERVGYRRLPCNLELHVTSRTDNMVFKQKRKLPNELQDSDGGKRASAPGFDIASCLGHKKLFEKCCSHRLRTYRKSNAEN